jgi:hypothetical protein
MHESDLGHGISSQRNLVLRKQLAGRRRSANGVQLFLDICTAPWSLGQGAVAFVEPPVGAVRAVRRVIPGVRPLKTIAGPPAEADGPASSEKGPVLSATASVARAEGRMQASGSPSGPVRSNARHQDASSQWSSGSFPQRQCADRMARCPDVAENVTPLGPGSMSVVRGQRRFAPLGAGITPRACSGRFFWDPSGAPTRSESALRPSAEPAGVSR